MQTHSIAAVAASRLCCSCGACAWACPQNAITYVETVGGYLLPKLDPGVCTECGICLSICPGAGLLPAVAARLPADPFAGIACQAYVGRAIDERLYANSQSGGIVSALLAHALDSGTIGGVIAAVMVEGTPPRTVARLVKNASALHDTQKSKYCPVPLLSILSEVEKQDRPVAFVGVGCQLHGLHNLCEQLPRLKGKIAFTIGLICDRTMTYAATDYLLKRTHTSAKDSKLLHFRDKACGGYPGSVHVVCSGGVSVCLPPSARMAIKDHFTPARCRLCFDKMNVLADITAGDPWGISGVDRIGGESLAVIRTDLGRHLFHSALDRRAVTARPIDYQQALLGQGIEHKRIDWRGYVDAWSELAFPLPSFCDQIRPYSCPLPEETDLYRRHLLQAVSLDHYPSRDALLAAVQRTLFSRKLKRIVASTIRAMKRMIERIAGRIHRGVH